MDNPSALSFLLKKISRYKPDVVMDPRMRAARVETTLVRLKIFYAQSEPRDLSADDK
jgi:hypothetical protein